MTERMIALVLWVAAHVAPLHSQATNTAERDTVTAAESGPVVTVTGGQVRGTALDNGGIVFFGIPYARPPVAALA